MTIYIIRFINIILAAILAGVSFGIWIGFNPMNLSPLAYVEQQQTMLHALRILMVALVISATLITITSAVLQRKNSTTFITLIIAAFFFIVCILITRFGNTPIDNVVMSWTTSALPGDWAVFRDKWWLFHILRTISELLALFLITAVNVRRD